MKGIESIFIAAMVIGLCSVVGLAMVATSGDVYDTLAGTSSFPTAANNAMNNTTATIYGVWPIAGLVVLALFGAAAIGAFRIFA